MVDRGREQDARIAALESALAEREASFTRMAASMGCAPSRVEEALEPFCDDYIAAVHRENEANERTTAAEWALAAAREKNARMKERNEPLVAVLLTEFGYPDDVGTDICTFAAKVLHEQRIALAAALSENERLRDACSSDREEYNVMLHRCESELAALRSATPAMDAGRVEAVREMIWNWLSRNSYRPTDATVEELARAVLAVADGPTAHRPDAGEGEEP